MEQRVPTEAELRNAIAEFDEEWGAVDAVLYDLCRTHPGHATLKHVMAKVALIGRGYASGIERCVQPAAGEQAIVLVGRHLHEHGSKVDEIIAAVQSTSEPLPADAMQRIVEQHGRLTALLGTMPQCTRAPRSFASKYLHFHQPAVPLFDSYVEAALAATIQRPARDVQSTLREGADPQYSEFCIRLAFLQRDCQERGFDAKTKALDAWLWNLGRQSASTRAQQRDVTVPGSQVG
jgi:hypothetical protein